MSKEIDRSEKKKENDCTKEKDGENINEEANWLIKHFQPIRVLKTSIA